MTTQEEIADRLQKIHHGWCGPEKAQALHELVLELHPTLCVEVGVYAGKSLLSTAYGLRDLKGGLVVGVDSWSNADCTPDTTPNDTEWWGSLDLEAIYDCFIKNLNESGLARYVRILRMNSLHASRILDEQVDLIHLDGSHSEWASTSDVCFWLPKLRVGGALVLDDTNWPTLETAVRFALKYCEKVKDIPSPESFSTIYRRVK